jgi:hypothetical protein
MTTGYVWQRMVDPRTFTQLAAQDYCQTLSLAGGGWRLPRRPEFMTIYDMHYWPNIDPIAFPNTPDEMFWTAEDQPCTVGFYKSSQGSPHADESFRARCVR